MVGATSDGRAYPSCVRGVGSGAGESKAPGWPINMAWYHEVGVTMPDPKANGVVAAGGVVMG
eukprot:3248782-Alexandrium_andersonii.AAC.1